MNSDVYGSARVRAPSTESTGTHRLVIEPRCPTCHTMWALAVTTPWRYRCRKCRTLSEST